eukprot:TRINITY_DN2313_c0_g2_i4.p1 TRINITY_DN2313_c0_g2~~TRINITY_DN2313_c0_g2_i4.p1  ORF type:complete len:227 (-),score=53.65 TRINITY_DN2313_c0_g2_i4:153-833(-)
MIDAVLCGRVHAYGKDRSDEDHAKEFDALCSSPCEEWSSMGSTRTKLSSEKEIVVHLEKKKHWKEGFDMLRARTTLPFPIDVVWECVGDLRNRPQLDPMTKSLQYISPTGVKHPVIQVVSNPFMVVASREFILHTRTIHHGRNSHSLILHSQDPPFGVSVPVSNAVRGRVLLSGFRVERKSNSFTDVVYLCSTDPQGWIPKDIVNLGVSKSAEILVHLARHMETWL